MIAAALQNKIIWSTAVQYFGKLVQMVLGIIAFKWITNALGTDDYGAYGKISEFALFFSTMANLGIFGNTVRAVSDRPTDSKVFVNSLILRLGTAAAFFGLGLFGAWIFIEDTGFFLGTALFMSALFFDYVTSVSDALLQVHYRMGRAVFALVLGRIVNLIVVWKIIEGTPSHEAPIFFLAPLCAAFVTAGISLFFVQQTVPFLNKKSWSIESDLLKKLFLGALPFGIINIFNSLYFRFLPSYFAAKVLSEEIYGSYNVNLHLASAAALVSTFAMFSTLPALKTALKENHLRTAHELIKKLRSSFFALGILLVAGGTLTAPFLIKLISDKEFLIPGFEFILPMMLVLSAISFYYDLVLISCFALKKELWFLKQEIVAVILALSIMLISLAIGNPAASLVLILLGAILAESWMVVRGLRKLKSLGFH